MAGYVRDLVVLLIHFIATLARLLGPGGARSLVAESLLLKHQLLILNRSRQRAPNLSASDRIFAGWRSGCHSNQGSLVISSGQNSVRPMHLFGHKLDHDYYFELRR
jgi:hypothetical protein